MEAGAIYITDVTILGWVSLTCSNPGATAEPKGSQRLSMKFYNFYFSTLHNVGLENTQCIGPLLPMP